MEVQWGRSHFVLSKRFRAGTLAALLAMHGAAVLGIVLYVWWQMSPALFVYTAASFTGLYSLSGFGVTIGNHRLFVHKSFTARGPVRVGFAILASMACEQHIMNWGIPHVIHHWFADKPGDPHSPAVPKGSPFLVRLKGFAWAHMGWLISPYEYPPVIIERAKRQLDSKVARFQQRTYYVWVVTGFALPALLAFPFWGWQGALQVLLIAGALRVVCVWHATWFVNSGTHLLGDRPNKIQSLATNLGLWIFALGEAFHNNHHADERCAWHGWKWYDPDLSKWIIWSLERLRLVSDVRRPRASKLPGVIQAA